MAQLNPWDEGYVQDAPDEGVAALNPWDEGYGLPTEELVPVQEAALVQQAPMVAPEDVLDDRGVPGGTPLVAPKVEQDLSLGRYDEMNGLDAMKDYEKLKSDPAAGRTMFGEVTIDNQVVPYPEISSGMTGQYEADTGFGQMMSNTARGAIKNTIVSAAAMIDEIAGTKGYNTNLAEKADKAIANRATGTALQEIVMQAGEYAAGAVAGYKIASPNSRGISASGNFSKEGMTRYFSKALSSFGSMVGAAATSNPETETAVVGSNAMTGDMLKGTIFAGVPVDENGKFSEQIIAKKLNILGDELTAGLAIRFGQAGAAKAAGVLKFLTYDQIAPLMSKGSREDEAVEMLMGALELGDGPEAISAVQKVVNENMDVWMKMGDDPNAFQMNRTVMSSLNEGLKETNPVAAKRAMEIESALATTSSPNLNTRLDLPVDEFHLFQKEQLKNKGGIDTINKSTDTLMEGGIKEVTDARTNVNNQGQAVRTAEEDTRQILRNDAMVGTQIKQAEADPTLDVNAFKTGAQEEVMKDLQGAANSINKNVDDLYAAIPEGVPIEEDSFIKTVVAAKDFVPNSIKSLIADEGTVLDYRTLNTQILPKVNEAIGAYGKSGNIVARDALIDIRDNIMDKQSAFVESMGGDAAKIAGEARKYFREVKVPFRDSQAVGKLFEKNANDYNMQDELQSVTSKIADNKIGTSKAIIDLIKRPEYKGDKKALFNVYLGDTVAQWSRKLNADGGIDNINPEDIVNSFGASAVQLKKEFPDEFKELEGLGTRLRNAKGNVKDQKAILDQVKERTKKIEEDVFNVSLRGFLKDMPDGTIQKTQNAYQNFKTLFNSDKNGNAVDEIVRRVNASGDPVAKKGLESAYFAYLKDRLGETAKGFSDKNAKRLISEPDLASLKDYGHKIFDNKEEVDDYVNVVRAIANEQDKRVPEGLALTSKGVPNFRDRGRVAADRGITFTLGVLNPTATMARNIARTMIDTSKGDIDKAKIFDLMVSDKEYFNKLMTKLGDKKAAKYTDEAKSVMWKLVTAAGIYNYDDEKVFNKTWDQAKKSQLSKETDKVLEKK